MCDHCGCRYFRAIAELTADHEQILELAWQVAERAVDHDTSPPRSSPTLPAKSRTATRSTPENRAGVRSFNSCSRMSTTKCDREFT